MRKNLISLLLFLFVFCNIYGQDPDVSFIITLSPRSYVRDSDIVFPVFRFRDNDLSKKINQAVVKKFKKNYYLEDSAYDIKALLSRMAEDGLAGLSYTLLRNDKLFLSFYLSVEWEAAYPSSWETYYCFDKSTGNLLTLDSLISHEKKWAFLNAVRSEQKKRMNKYRAEMLRDLKNKEIEKEEYDFAISEVQDDCWRNFDPGSFKLSTDKFEIIIDCGFPHSALAISPSFDLSLSLNFLRQYTKPKYKVL